MQEPNEVEREITVRHALGIVVAHKHEKSLNYAVNYAKAGMDMAGEELKVQCLYVLNNMSRWRGEQGKYVRKVLKDFTSVK